MTTDVTSALEPAVIAAPDDAGAVMLDPVTDELDETELAEQLLAKATAIIECELWREYDGGDHAIIVGQVKNLVLPAEPVTPMVYHKGKLGALPPLG